MKKVISILLVSAFLLAGCSGSSKNVANDKVCKDIVEIMDGSGYMQGTRESLLNATTNLVFYEPDPVEDWVPYVSPANGSYAPSANDNDNAVYQNLYRLQAQAMDYIDTRNAGAFYNEWKMFQEGCGISTE